MFLSIDRTSIRTLKIRNKEDTSGKKKFKREKKKRRTAARS